MRRRCRTLRGVGRAQAFGDRSPEADERDVLAFAKDAHPGDFDDAHRFIVWRSPVRPREGIEERTGRVIHARLKQVPQFPLILRAPLSPCLADTAGSDVDESLIVLPSSPTNPARSIANTTGKFWTTTSWTTESNPRCRRGSRFAQIVLMPAVARPAANVTACCSAMPTSNTRSGVLRGRERGRLPSSIAAVTANHSRV